MKHEEFLVTAERGRKFRKVFWDGSEPFPINHPATWVLEKNAQGEIFVRNTAGDDFLPLELAFEQDQESKTVEIPDSKGIFVTLQRLKPIRAAYQPAYYPKPSIRPPQFFVFSGQRYMMTDYRPVESAYQGNVLDVPVWGYVRNDLGYQITAYRNGVKLKMPGGRKKTFKVGVTEFVTDADFYQATVTWEEYWWRVNKIPTPDALPLESFEDPEARDARWFSRFSTVVASMLIVGFVALQYIAEDWKTIELPPQPTTIALKAPKIIPQMKKPEPPKLVAKVEPPKPKPVEKKKPEPPKVAKVKPPKPKKERRIVKRPTPPKAKPKMIAKAPPKPQVKPKPLPPAPAPKIALHEPTAPKKLPPAPPKTSVAPPPQVAKAPTPPKPDLQAIQRAAAEQEKARQQAKLATALNFLSPSLNKKASGGVFTDKSATKYNAGGPSAVAAANVANGKSVLNSIASNEVREGQIQTTGARNIASDRFTATGGRGKGLNEVQGKVSLNSLYDPNAGADLGASMSGKGGLQMMGPGQLSESEIQKVLAKHLARFQYCYEKSLLNSPTLGGTITMQWTIQPGGAALHVKVARSQMNNAGLHACMTKELSAIRFPSPRGGEVTIKYPFSFTSSTL